MIRLATETDVSELSEVCSRSFLDTYKGKVSGRSDEFLHQYVKERFNPSVLASDIASPNLEMAVAVVDEKIAGYYKIVHAVPPCFAAHKNLICLERLYLLKEYKGRGLGTALLKESERRAAALGVQGLWLSVWEENISALNFYLRQGFVKVGHGKWEFEFNGVNYIDVDWILAKDLVSVIS